VQTNTDFLFTASGGMITYSRWPVYG